MNLWYKKFQIGKSYPELQILVSISDQFDVSLDAFAETGIIVSCLFSPDSSVRTTVIIVGIIMVCIGWYKKSKSDKKLVQYIKEYD